LFLLKEICIPATLLDKPKSHIFQVKSLLINILAGFKSL